MPEKILGDLFRHICFHCPGKLLFCDSGCADISAWPAAGGNKKDRREHMLELTNVTKYYGKTLAADQVSFSIPDGAVGVLLGPNGAGKSTIIKSIAGLLKYKGTIAIQGIDARQREARAMFAYVPEIPAMYNALTVEEHMEFIRRAYRLTAGDEEVQALLERFELWDKRDKLGDELSKGMMQKVSICCALLIRPRVILLDEPMVGLDPQAIKELKTVVQELRNQGTTVLISTHMLEMVQELWDYVFVMEKAKIIAGFNREQASGQDLDDLFFKVTEKWKAQEESQSGQEESFSREEKKKRTVTGKKLFGSGRKTEE